MSRSRAAVVVLAKAPRPGAVKTRLCPPFTPEQAAALQGAMLADVLELTAGFATSRGLDAVLAVEPGDARAELARVAPPGFRLVSQFGVDLGARMSWAVREVAASGARRVLLRGSDSPALGEGALREALEALEEADLALAPDRDGGYGLVALRAPARGLFDHPMSTDRVLHDTLAKARSLGLRTRLLAPGFDVDRPRDLAALAEARAEVASRCPRTLAFLDAQALWRLAGQG